MKLSASQTITITDTTPPVVIVPTEQEDVTCEQVDVATAQAYLNGDLTDAEEDAYDLFLANLFLQFNLLPTSVTDNCDPNVDWIHFLTLDFNVECPLVAVMICNYYAIDECGNVSDTVQTFANVIDNQAPELIGVPADITVECGNVPDAPTVTGLDDCNFPVGVVMSETMTDGCPYTVTRTWTGTDACGNETVETQVITVDDTMDPMFVEALPGNADAECDNVPAAVTLTATDDCDTDVPVIYSESTTPGSCIDAYTITRTWTATDDCGNEITHTQTVNVSDTTDPVFVDPPAVEIDVECENVPDPSDLMATDNCDDDVTIVFSELEFSGGCTLTYERTWVATDNCGNSTTFVQLVHLIDTTPPVLVGVPADATYECDETIPDATVTATDNCDDDVVPTFTETSVPGDCPQESVITRTWTAIDDCLNEVSASQTITITDTTPPVVIVPTEQEDVTCEQVDVATAQAYLNGDLTDAEEDAYDLFLANLFLQFNLLPTSVTDNCDPNVDWIHFLTLDFNVECPLVAVMICNYYAIDECGNVSDTVQTFANVIDNQAPELIGVPADITVECGNVPDAPTVTGLDDCNFPVGVVMSETMTDGCPYTVTRTWTGTDACGNETVETQVITVDDTMDPMFVEALPGNADAECDNVPAAVTLTATDDCDTDVPVIYNESTTPGVCTDTYTITRTWTATDDCGNEISHTQTVNVSDTTDPVFVDPPAVDIDVECEDVPDPSDLMATDNCDTDVDITFSELVFSGGCTETLERTWVATDNCGNSATFVQLVHLIDTTDPVLSDMPADITVDCDNVPVAPVLTATDNCDDDVAVTYAESNTSGNCDGNYTISRTWTAIDDCMNEVSYTQTVTVTDTQAPTFTGTLPANMEVDCNNVPDAPTLDAVDNCSGATVSMAENSSTGCPYTITRVWTAVDGCGNSVDHTQVITVVDTQDPVIGGVPADVTVECGNVPDAPTLTATDNCDTNVPVVYNESSTTGDCNYTITRTWTAIDDCNNQAVGTQVITVTDSMDPVFGALPADDTVECDNIPDAATVTAVDACQGAITPTFSEVTTANPICGSTIVRTWVADDGCGNSVTHNQTITVVDTTDPVFTNVPADEVYDCDDVIPAAVAPDVTDNCDTDVDVVFSEVTEGNDDPNLFCNLATPIDNVIDDDIWAMWLPNLDGSNSNYVIDGAATFNEIDLGGGIMEAHVIATLYDPLNPDRIWELDAYFIDKKEWTEWSNSMTIELPIVNRSFKDDYGYAAAGGDLWETWQYWILDASRASLTGEGVFTGSELSLHHEPSSLYYGFQVGEAANNRNATYGMSGWFGYEGNFQGNFVNGVGDFGFEADCPPCDYTITRTWTATDDCGNTAVAMQVVEVSSPFLFGEEEEEEELVIDTPPVSDITGFINSYPNPTKAGSNIVFNIPNDDTNVRIEVLSTSGEVIRVVYQGNAESRVDKTVTFDEAHILTPGVFIYRLTTSNNVYTSKLIINK